MRREPLTAENLQTIADHAERHPELKAHEVGSWAATQFPACFNNDTTPRSCWEYLRQKSNELGVPITLGYNRPGRGKKPKSPTQIITEETPDEAITVRKPDKLPDKGSGFQALVWDLETTDLNSFMGRLIVASFLDLNTERIRTRTLLDFSGDVLDQEAGLLRWTVGMISEADVLIGHNTLSFDNGFLRGRLAAHNMDLGLPKRHHIDTLQLARHGFKGRPQGYSLENLLDFFQCAVQKNKPSKHEWAGTRYLNPDDIRRIAVRCEEDVRGNAQLWYVLRPYYHQWRGK